MTKKITSALLVLVMLAACQKTDTTKSSLSQVTKSPELINSARSFFEKNILAMQSKLSNYNSKGKLRRQQVHKTPLWDMILTA